MVELEIKNLNKSYGDHVIFDNAEFTMRGGDVVAFVGENGSGKSTLLNILAGLLKSYKGDISVTSDGNKIALDKAYDFISYVPQSNYLIDSLSAYDNLLFWYKGDSKRLKEDIASGAVKEFGIDKFIKKPIRKLSGGMQKRVAIACALAGNPKILLLDEVCASLDIVCKLQIQKVASDYAKKGNIVIMSTHEEGDISICTRTCFINNKKLNEIPVTSLKEIFKDKL